MKRIAYAIITALALTACQESLEERCAREAEEYTKKKCPARIDQNTVIDSLVFERATHTMHYYYTLTGTADDPKTFTMFNAENVLLTQLKNSTMIKTYKDAGEIQKHLEGEGFEVTGAEFTRIPNDQKEVTAEERETIEKMVEKLEDFDDVQTVYTNMKPADE